MNVQAEQVIAKLKLIIAEQAGQIAILEAMVEELQKPTDT